MATIFIIDDNQMMTECLERAVLASDTEYKCCKFYNIIDAVYALDVEIPDLIVMDIMLNGPNGISFLNELSAYSDTNRIPIVIVTYLDIQRENLQKYNVKAILNKTTMTPTEIKMIVQEVLKVDTQKVVVAQGAEHAE